MNHVKPLSPWQQHRREFHAWKRQHSAGELCLAHARNGKGDHYLVRIPSAVRVGSGFASRLGARAEELSASKIFRAFVPLAKLEPGWRNYILRDYWCCGGRYVLALAQALKELGALNMAQVFVADVGAGVMRRIGSLPAAT